MTGWAAAGVIGSLLLWHTYTLAQAEACGRKVVLRRLRLARRRRRLRRWLWRVFVACVGVIRGRDRR